MRRARQTIDEKLHVAGVNTVTRISQESCIRRGILVSTNDIRIDGRFEGTILTKGKVILGEHSAFKGDIVCANADIYGTMDGNIAVGGLLTLMRSCNVNGLIKLGKLGVENGAKFEGTCTVITSDDFAGIVKQYEAKIDSECPETIVSAS